ncbi:MAG: ArsR/SmtB family transcription factor [Candidatus Ornithospirochaeta sp.]
MEEKIISEEEIVDMADFFKVFGDPTRLRILFLLWLEEECSVGTISEKVKMSQSAVSQQLKILRSSRLVKFRKEGRSILYRLSDDHITKILQLGLEHYDELLG